MKRNRILLFGTSLLSLFYISVFLICSSILYKVVMDDSWWNLITENLWGTIVGSLLIIIIEAIVFWVGIILIYATSVQLGIRWRVVGVIFGWTPVINLVVLACMIKICYQEAFFEMKKIKLDESRKLDQICATKYPVLLVHGVFFRDFKHLNYWGRVPAVLEKNGAKIFYGEHSSAASVEECGKELSRKILEIIEQTGCEKVNIIAHSKGGLDSRSAISLEGMDKYIASLTTINTPHRGCEFADYLLNKIGEKERRRVAEIYEAGARRMGDKNPNFIAAVSDLTATSCAKFNEKAKNVDGIFYQSYGSKLNHVISGQFPLNMSHSFVGHFDGANDGLVGEKSCGWGEKFTFITIPGRRGVSHGDVIDLNRQNIKGYDVREFYVDLLADLKKRGF